MKKNQLIFGLFVLQSLCWHNNVNAQLNFKPFQTYKGVNSATIRSISLGDFNKDGKQDIVVAAAWIGHGGLHILTNNGDGSYTAPVLVNLPGTSNGTVPLNVTVDDVNGDTYPDMVTSNQTFFPPGSISVFLNDGTGNFASPVFYQSGLNPGKAIIKDLNGDNKPDIVAANGQDTFISVYMNNGNGTFAPQVTYDSYSPAIFAEDFNSDGKTDLVVHSLLTDSIGSDYGVSIMLNNGNGGFIASPPVITQSKYLRFSEIADLNNDNEPDLIFTDGGIPKQFLIYFNTGNAPFGAPINYVIGPNADAETIVAVDMNDDNKKDLVISSSYPPFNYIFLNAGNGNLSAPIKIPCKPSARGLCVADLNGDNKLDFVNGAGHDSLIIVTLQDNNTSINIPDLAKSDVNVFPNPGKEMVTVLSSINDRLSVYDAVGRLLIEHVIVKGANAIDISSLSSGFYIFEVGEQKIKFEKRK